MTAPAVSVIIPTFNRCEVLRYAMLSVCAQTFSDWELLIVGDGCTDDSETVVREVADHHGTRNSIRFLALPTNSGGQAAPNNAGLAAANAPLAAFLGHDDLWFPWHLDQLLRVRPHTGVNWFAHSLSAMLGPDGLRSVFGNPGPGRTYDDVGIIPSSCLVPRQMVIDLGGFDETLRSGSDLDLVRRARANGALVEVAQRLSVLKYPSHWFDQPYKTRGAEPQRSHWQRIADDAEQMERDVLYEVFAGRVRADMGLSSTREGVATLARSVKNDAIRTLLRFEAGRAWIDRRHEAIRQQRRHVRGL